MEPAAQTVGPVYPVPPHWPYFATVPAADEVAGGTAVVGLAVLGAVVGLETGGYEGKE